MNDEQIAAKAAHSFRSFTKTGKIGIDDLLQVARLGIIEAKKTYVPERGSFKSYANRIARAEVYKEIHRHGRTVRAPRRDLSVPFSGRQCFESDEKSALMVDPIESRELYNAIEQLSGRQRVVIKSLFFEDLSMSEIADQTGVSKESIYIHKLRALKVLKKALS